ncbi:MAG: ParB/RepB/Spo0J family partition protein [Actinobacteria bacterium]|nr:ParB/RepB/Spo0J family partition protein [Actinomycetota bacterium]
MNKRGLGRGLDALLPSAPSVAESDEGSGSLREVSVGALTPNPRQPRSDFDEDALQELTSSIETLGILQPLLVRELGPGRYELVAGERRWRAAQRAGIETVPVLVVETDERGSLERALVENVHRQDLNPIEEAAAYRQLLDEGGLTQEALGERVGKNRVTISNAMRLLDLPVSVQRMIAEGRLTGAHGKALLALEGNAFLERLARRAADERWSTRETEEHVRRYQSMSTTTRSTSTKSSEESAAALDAQRRLAGHLQTRVRVEVGKRKGRIVLDFVSVDELERITNLITGAQDGPSHTAAIPS